MNDEVEGLTQDLFQIQFLSSKHQGAEELFKRGWRKTEPGKGLDEDKVHELLGQHWNVSRTSAARAICKEFSKPQGKVQWPKVEHESHCCTFNGDYCDCAYFRMKAILHQCMRAAGAS